jgi:hypothetical protein
VVFQRKGAKAQRDAEKFFATLCVFAPLHDSDWKDLGECRLDKARRAAVRQTNNRLSPCASTEADAFFNLRRLRRRLFGSVGLRRCAAYPTYWWMILAFGAI